MRSSRRSTPWSAGSGSSTAWRTTAVDPSWTSDPREAGGKREAVDRLVDRHRPGAIAVLGDEMSDIDAFEAVVAARTAPTGGDPVVGVTIAVHGATRPAPSELLAVADLRLSGAHDVGRWLAALARRLDADDR